MVTRKSRTNSNRSQYSLVLPFVAEATSRFVKAQAMREVISLALASGKPAIFYGPGGHGKSEFVQAVFECISDASAMTQFFGEGMDEARLFGGVNLAAINDPVNPRIEYNPERSFLNADLFVAEEGFDAPPVVLLSWKDALTSKALRNGAQTFRMKTKTIVLLTNRQPSELSEMGDAVQALVERFPLQLVVNWPAYKAADFLELFNSLDGHQNDGCPEFSILELMELQQKAREVVVPYGITMVLAELISHAVEAGGRISPRTAVHARDLVAASAAINNRDTAEEADIIACKYLPGMEAVAATIEEKIKAASQRAHAETLLHEATTIFDQIAELARRANIMDKLKIAALLELLSDEIAQKINPPTELVERRDKLAASITELFGKLGGNTELYPEVRVELPDSLLGTNFVPTIPRTGSLRVGELKEARKVAFVQVPSVFRPITSTLFDEDDEEDDEEEIDKLEEDLKKVPPRSSRPQSPFKPSGGNK